MGHGETALVDHGTVFLLQLHEYRRLQTGPAVAADTELFLVDRPLQAAADEAEVGGIQVEIADGAVAVLVGHHIGRHRGQDGLLLPAAHLIFDLISLKDHLIFHGCGVLFEHREVSIEIQP